MEASAHLARPSSNGKSVTSSLNMAPELLSKVLQPERRDRHHGQVNAEE